MVAALDVICLGEMLIDFVPAQARQPLVSSNKVTLAPGGAPANVAVAASRLGLGAGFIGKVGDDPFGRLLKQTLASQRVDLNLFRLSPQSLTRLAFVTNDADERQRFLFYGDPGADTLLKASEIRGSYFKQARVFHFGSISLIQEPSRSATFKALELAHQHGLIVSFDPNLRPSLWPSLKQARREILNAMRFCHVLKVNDMEWEFLFPGSQLRHTAMRLTEQIAAPALKGIQMLAVTRGEKGVLLAGRDSLVKIKALPVKVVDTTGAGDGFMAGLIFGIVKRGSLALNREELERVGRLATIVGSLTCKRAGAIPAFPTLQQVQRQMQNNVGY